LIYNNKWASAQNSAEGAATFQRIFFSTCKIFWHFATKNGEKKKEKRKKRGKKKTFFLGNTMYVFLYFASFFFV